MTTPHQRLLDLRLLCPGLDDEVLRDFASRMDPEYFERFAPADIARHIGLANRLDPDHPAQIAFSTGTDGLTEIVLVAYDYFSEFSAVCGLLSAFGLDIREGAIYTFSEPAPGPPPRPAGSPRRPRHSRPGLSRKKIVDVFRVRPVPGETFGADRREQLTGEILVTLRLLEEQRLSEARRLINRRLVEALGKRRSTFSGMLHPIEVRFDNALSPTHTVMDIRSTDTPAFLFAFANALAMRGIYIHQARLAQTGTELHDRFWIRDRHGHKLDRSHEQQELRVTAVLIKQFTHFLSWAPDPGKAIEHFDQFLDRILEEAKGSGNDRALAFLKDKRTMTLLARLLGTSDYLWEDFLRRQHANLLPVLEDYRHAQLIRPRDELTRELARRVARVRTDDARQRALNQFKDRELFRIDMVHLMDPASTLPDFSRALTDLAEVVLEQATKDCQAALAKTHGAPRLPGRAPCPFAIFGLGKFGGGELGYASDIEVLFSYGGPGQTGGRKTLDNSEYFERLAQSILRRIEARHEGIFHLDVRLRPHGSKGLLVNTLDELSRYYSPGGQAAPFERQALIKLRYVAGDALLGRQVEVHRDAFVYSGEPWDLAIALDLRRQQLKELVEPRRINVKYSRGGLIDIEYGVQYLQLMEGHREPRLRSPNTLAALSALADTGVLTNGEAAFLREAYLFLRLLIDGLRIVRGHAKDLLLPSPESEEFVFLARRLGYHTESWEAGAAKLGADIRQHMQRTEDFFGRRFGKV